MRARIALQQIQLDLRILSAGQCHLRLLAVPGEKS
jgi:hypothetical protein